MSARPRYTLAGITVGGGQRAFDSHLQRDVLLKPWWSPDDRASLRATISALTALQNKHIADIYDLIEMTPGRELAVVEEYLSGSDLDAWSSAGLHDEGATLRILLQMVGGVAALHSCGLSAPSLESKHWRFDAEGLLNLSVFGAGPPGHRGRAPERLDMLRRAADLRRLAEHARGLAARHLARPSRPVPALADPMLSGLWSGNPPPTDTLDHYYQRLQAWILRDQHRAMIIYRQRSSEINAKQRSLRLTHPIANIAEATISYDGTMFTITALGEVYLNNIWVTAPALMPGSCILTLGAPTRNWTERHFITFDASQPEVVF